MRRRAQLVNNEDLVNYIKEQGLIRLMYLATEAGYVTRMSNQREADRYANT